MDDYGTFYVHARIAMDSIANHSHGISWVYNTKIGYIYALIWLRLFFYCFFLYQSEPNPNLASLVTSLIVALWVVVMIFLTCESGERLTNQYDIFEYEYDQCNWYSFPLEIQRTLPILISSHQRPAMVQGYAHTVCRRASCATVTFLRFCWVFLFDKLKNSFKFSLCFFLLLSDGWQSI